MNIYKSRFTKGATAEEIKLNINDVVTVRFQNLREVKATIKSGLMIGVDDNLVYEVVTHDNNKFCAVHAKAVIDWKGKDEA